MKITGTLTDFGEKLVADQLLNGRNYTVRDIVAGSGDTPLTATYLYNQRQSLTMTTEVVDGVTVYHATLSMAAATSSYTLTELGINAYYNSTGLFKLYKLSQPIEIDNSQDHTIRFTFRDSDVAGALHDGYVVPESIVTYEILMDNLHAEHTYHDETVTFSCTQDELEGVLATIPRRLDKNYVINLTESSVYGFTIEGKYGKGSIKIRGMADQTAVTSFTRVTGTALITDCDAKVSFEDIRFVCRNGNDSSFHAKRCKNLEIIRCEIGAVGEDSYMLRCYDCDIRFVNCPVSESKGSGSVVFEGCDVVMDYDPARVFNRAFMPGGTAFFTLRGYTRLVCMGSLTDSVLDDIMWTYDKAVMVSRAEAGQAAKVMMW